jgi:hypothetical protein
MQLDQYYAGIAVSGVFDAILLSMMTSCILVALYRTLFRRKLSDQPTYRVVMDLLSILVMSLMGWLILVLLQPLLLWIGSGHLNLSGTDLITYEGIITNAFALNQLTFIFLIVVGTGLGLIWGHYLSAEIEDGMSRFGVSFTTLGVSFFLCIIVLIAFQILGYVSYI